MQKTKIYFRIIAVLGSLAVILGAFGAHALKSRMDVTQVETFKTASIYHFIHLIAMLVLVFAMTAYKGSTKILSQTYYFWCIGILCFSGSLYLLSCKHLIGGDIWNFVGPITPIGGLLFILGWLNLGRFTVE